MPDLTLITANKNYSSWSMRAWLTLRWLGRDFDEIRVPVYQPGSKAEILRHSPSGFLPALRDGDIYLWDSLAIIQHLADTSPQVWPDDPQKRAFVRSISAEMHSGFFALRGAMPHNARGRDRRVPRTPDVEADIARIEHIWTEGLERFGGPWIAGDYGVGDIMYTPIASRFRTYGVTLSGPAEVYRRALLDHPLAVRWFAEGANEVEYIAESEVGLAEDVV
jgi:glutathione S-transferase